MPAVTEQEFITRIQSHSGILHKVIGLYVDNVEDQRDLQQEIILQAWKSYPKFAGKSSFATWLYRVSLNTVLGFRRKTSKQLQLQADLPPPASTTNGNDNAQLLYELVKRLNEVDRMVITLHLEGYGNHEIAEVMDLKANHINVKLHRLKKRIIAQLQQLV